MNIFVFSIRHNEADFGCYIKTKTTHMCTEKGRPSQKHIYELKLKYKQDRQKPKCGGV